MSAYRMTENRAVINLDKQFYITHFSHGERVGLRFRAVFFSQSSGSLQCQNCSMGRLRERERERFLEESFLSNRVSKPNAII